MNRDKDHLFYLLDVFMSEYKWTYDYALNFIFNTPHDILDALCEKILKRHKIDLKVQTQLMTTAIGCALSGKTDIIDKIFNDKEPEEISLEAHKAQLRSLWEKLGKDPSKFDEAYASGNVEM